MALDIQNIFLLQNKTGQSDDFGTTTPVHLRQSPPIRCCHRDVGCLSGAWGPAVLGRRFKSNRSCKVVTRDRVRDVLR